MNLIVSVPEFTYLLSSASNIFRGMEFVLNH